MPAGLTLTAISKQFAAHTVVDKVSLEVADGELLVLVGPSGSGKSTLLRMIAGLIEHDAGQIEVGGRDVGNLPPAQRDIAMVFQSYALFPHLCIRDNLAFGMQARGEAKALIDERIASVSAVLGLAPMLDRYPRQLSGGERQRVALGRAMLRQPKLFLLDEPLSNLDAQLRVQTRAEILRLHQKLKTTMVYVTHDQIEALSMGDRIGVMRGGVLEDIGTPIDIYRRPRSLFVAQFVGSPAMNTLAVAAADAGVLWQGQVLPVGAHLSDVLGTAGRELVLGVRPEHVCLEGSRWAQGAPGELIEARVEVVEYAGDQVFLELESQGVELIARVEPEFQVQRGQTVSLWFAPDCMHLFDAKSGQSLLQRALA